MFVTSLRKQTERHKRSWMWLWFCSCCCVQFQWESWDCSGVMIIFSGSVWHCGRAQFTQISVTCCSSGTTPTLPESTMTYMNQHCLNLNRLQVRKKGSQHRIDGAFNLILKNNLLSVFTGQQQRLKRFYPGGDLMDFLYPTHSSDTSFLPTTQHNSLAVHWFTVTDRASLLAQFSGTVCRYKISLTSSHWCADSRLSCYTEMLLQSTVSNNTLKSPCVLHWGHLMAVSRMTLWPTVLQDPVKT